MIFNFNSYFKILNYLFYFEQQNDSRRYYTPTANEVAAIIVGSDQDRMNYGRVDTLDSNPTTSARANHIAHNIQPNNNSNLSFQSQINHQQNTSYNIANQRQLNFSDHLPLTVSNYSHISTRIPQINLTNVNIIQSFYI